MNKHIRSLSLLALALLSLLALPASRVHAEDSYKSIINEALEEFQNQNWLEARSLFKRAHELSPSARTLRGSGVSAYEAKLYVAAIADLSEALASKQKPLTKAQHDECQRVLERAQSYVVHLTLTVTPSNAELTIDGKPVVLDASSTMLIDPGVHELVAHAEGYENQTQRVDAEAGDQLKLDVQLHTEAENAPAPIAMETMAPPQATSAAPSTEKLHLGVWPWVAAGGAVAFLGAGIAFHVASSSGAANVEDACPSGRCSLAQINKRIDSEHIQTFDALAVTAWVIAGASAVTSVVLCALDGSEHQTESASAQLRVAPGSVTLSGQF